MDGKLIFMYSVGYGFILSVLIIFFVIVARFILMRTDWGRRILTPKELLDFIENLPPKKESEDDKLGKDGRTGSGKAATKRKDESSGNGYSDTEGSGKIPPGAADTVGENEQVTGNNSGQPKPKKEEKPGR